MSDVEVYKLMQSDPIFFVKVMYGLERQMIKPEFQDDILRARDMQDYSELRLGMFAEYEQ